MLKRLAKIVTFGVAVNAAQQLHAAAELRAPRLLNHNKEQIEAINITELKTTPHLYIDVEDTISGLVGALSWQIMVMDFQTNRIVYSTQGENLPENHISWDGKLDSGSYAASGKELGVRILVKTSEKQWQSAVMKVRVIESKELFRKLDRGLRFSPAVGAGYARVVIKDDAGKATIALPPLVMAHLDFHYYRTHMGGIQLHSTSNLSEKFEPSYYTKLVVHYQYALVNRLLGTPINWYVGLNAFMLKLGTVINDSDYQAKSDLSDGDSVTVWDLTSRGAAAETRFQWFFTDTASLEFESFYGQSLTEKKGDITSYDVGTNTMVTEQLALRLMVGQTFIKQSITSDDGTMSKRQADMTSIKLFVDVAM